MDSGNSSSKTPSPPTLRFDWPQTQRCKDTLTSLAVRSRSVENLKQFEIDSWDSYFKTTSPPTPPFDWPQMGFKDTLSSPRVRSGSVGNLLTRIESDGSNSWQPIENGIAGPETKPPLPEDRYGWSHKQSGGCRIANTIQNGCFSDLQRLNIQGGHPSGPVVRAPSPETPRVSWPQRHSVDENKEEGEWGRSGEGLNKRNYRLWNPSSSTSFQSYHQNLQVNDDNGEDRKYVGVNLNKREMGMSPNRHYLGWRQERGTSSSRPQSWDKPDEIPAFVPSRQSRRVCQCKLRFPHPSEHPWRYQLLPMRRQTARIGY